MSSTILRQWLVLGMLPKPPRRIDTASIEARLRSRGIDVHRRTIQRDLLELAEIFPIVADERAKPYGWRWADDAERLLPVGASRPTNGPRVPVSLRVSGAHVDGVLESLGVSVGEYDIVARGDLLTTVVVLVQDTESSRRAVFGVSDVVEIVGPEDWRREIASRAHQVLARHAPPSAGD